MKRKIILLAAFILLGIMLLSSCGEKHEWSKSLLYDQEFHWYECEECGEQKDKEKHTIQDQSCTECEYIIPTEHIVYEVSEDGTYAIVVGYEGTETEVVIANEYNNLPVTSIGEDAFAYCDSLVSVTIPDSVTSIGYGAFAYCDSLVSVTIPDSVTSIGYTVFWGCSSLTSVTIPDSVTSIDYGTFFFCSSLVSVTIPDSVISIDSSAFYNCDSLMSVDIPNSVTYIGTSAFYNCDSLVSVTIPDSVTSISICAFEDCDSLTSIIVDENNKYYKSIDGNLYSKDGKTLIQYAIGKKDTSFEIPFGVTSIDDWGAFSGCDRLVNIDIPDSVEFIGFRAFEGCSSLTSVVIGDSVTSIGDNVFGGCDNLTSIIVDENNKYYKSIDGNLYSKDGKTLVQYAIGKEDTSFEIPNSVTSIGFYAFYYCSSLVSVTIPDSVTSIGDWAFAGCAGLVNATIPDSVTSIGDWAFSGCSGLASVTIPDSVTSIGDNAFAYCDSLTEVYYNGSAAEWNSIYISSYGNDPLNNATRYYYSENQPTKDGNYWHWVDGEVVVWE